MKAHYLGRVVIQGEKAVYVRACVRVCAFVGLFSVVQIYAL